MSTLQVTNLQNASSGIINGTLNPDGTSTFGGIINFASGQTFPAFSGGTPPVGPTIGDTWYDTSTSPAALKVWNGSNWVPVSATPSGATPPATPIRGTTWYDTTLTPPVFKVWNNSAWVPVSLINSNTAPVSPTPGQLWSDTNSVPAVLKVWSGSAWVPSGPTVGTVAPTGPIVGQLWSDTNTTPATLKTWNGSAWVPVQAAGGGGSGTVTSIDVSGGTTGLTTSGGPVTASGTITIGGTLAVASGGTGATTQAAAQANLLPAQAGNAGKFLRTDGAGVLSWAPENGTGTVTSVDVSGGTTGLTYSGGPITAAGTVTMAGILALANGGTGASTQAGAQANLLPTQTGNTGKVLSTDGAGVLSWITPGATVQAQPAPTPADIGDLWYDCTTGTLKVYQTCTTPNGWTSAAQSGLNPQPNNTTASPPFTNAGSPTGGTSGNPWLTTVSTVATGGSIFIVNTVTITGLAPNQYVPIVDLNSFTNGNRFSFSNFYADGFGVLVFQTIFNDAPASPDGTSYTANIKIGYDSVYVSANVNIVDSFSTTPGSIAGNGTVGATLTYTTGVASGGTGPYTYTWTWRKASDNSILQTDGSTYVVGAGLVGDNVYVQLTATDSSAATTTASTANYPASPATITSALAISSPGSIAGTASLGATLIYTTGTATGGISPYTYGWVWKRATDNTVLQTGGSTYLVSAGDVGNRVYVALTATDSVSATATGNTTTYPAAPATITPALSLSSTGFITGDFTEGATVTYGTGTATGGISPYNYTWTWRKANDNTILQTGGATYTINASEVGERIYVALTATDSVSATVSGVTDNYPASPAVITGPLTLSSPGSIAGTADVGSTLTYTTGTATGGISPYTYAWVWKRTSDDTLLQTDGSTYLIVSSDLGDNVYVELTATDSIAATATANTADYPTPPATIQPQPITNAVAPTLIPGTDSFTWADGSTNLTATGCIEFSVNGGPFGVGPTAVVDTDVIQTKWVYSLGSGVCGDAADGVTITGSLSDGPLTSNFSLLIDKVPSAFVLSPNTETTTPNTVTVVNPSFTIAGTNAPCYLWGTFATTGSTPEYSIASNSIWAPLPSTPGSVLVNPGTTVQVRYTTGSSPTTEVLTVNAGTSVTAKQSANFTVTVSVSQFPTSTFSPVGGPNASPASVSVAGQSLYGTANCASWADGSTTLTSTGGLQFRVGTAAYSTGPTAVTNSDTVDLIWDPAVITAAADGATLTGTLTNGSFTNTYTIIIDRSPLNLSFSNLTDQSLSSTITAGSITATGFNTPVPISLAGTATNPLTTLRVSVNGGGFATSPQTVNPGESLQIQGITGATLNTAYGVNVTMGSGPSATTTWTATTVTALPSITTPSITSPANNATNLDPGLNSPAGIPLVGDSYTPTNGAGAAQTSSEWEVYKGGFPLGPSTNTITAVSAGTVGTLGGIKYKTSNSGDTPTATFQNTVYGFGATTAGNDAAHPMFQWAKALSIGGFSDWYIPAKNELEILYYNLKPGATANDTGSGINPNAVPARASNYTASTPAQTTIAPFAGGAEAFLANGSNAYWSSSQDPGFAGGAWRQAFDAGNQDTFYGKNSGNYARVIRRIPIADYVSAGSPAIGTYLAGGYYAGQISTAGNSTADYALIVAPNSSGAYNYTGGTNASLTIAGANTDGFLTGLTIKGNTSNATGIILSINATTIGYLPTSGTFVNGETISTDPASYTALANSPYSGTVGALTSSRIPQADLAVASTYYARHKYATTNPTAATSLYSAWSSFKTASSFSIPIGSAMGGGYYAGQIKVFAGEDGGGLPAATTIYNLIVAPVATGQYPGGGSGGTPGFIAYKTSASADSPAATYQNAVYGKPANDANSTSTYPAFQWARSLSIGGFIDWYIPAKNELEILYYNLKPGTTSNITWQASNNPNAVPARTSNYTAGTPAQTTTADFKNGGSEAFSTANYYWSSTENSTNTNQAWIQKFSDGDLFADTKNNNFAPYARAIRRVLA